MVRRTHNRVYKPSNLSSGLSSKAPSRSMSSLAYSFDAGGVCCCGLRCVQHVSMQWLLSSPAAVAGRSNLDARPGQQLCACAAVHLHQAGTVLRPMLCCCCSYASFSFSSFCCALKAGIRNNSSAPSVCQTPTPKTHSQHPYACSSARMMMQVVCLHKAQPCMV